MAFYRTNDVVRIATLMKTGVQVYTARVATAERGEDHRGRKGWWLTLVPCSRPDSGQFGHASVLIPDSPTEWGVQACEVIGEETPPPFRPYAPRPGDRYYDPMG